MFLSLTATVYAGDIMGDRLLRILAEVQKPSQTPSENFNVDNPFGHAEIKPGVKDATSALVGDDSAIIAEENILGNATPESPVQNVLSMQEGIDDQQYGVLSGTGPNEDESTRYKAELDSKLSNVKPEVKVLDKANPNSAAAAA